MPSWSLEDEEHLSRQPPRQCSERTLATADCPDEWEQSSVLLIRLLSLVTVRV